MALLLLFFFLVSGELYSCNAQTTDRSTSPSAETVRNANATAETTVPNVNATADSTVGYANTTAQTTVTNVIATVFNSTNSSTPSPPLTESQASETSADYHTSTSTFTDFQSMTLHQKVSLSTRGSINNSRISEALLSYLSRILLQSTCKNCSLRIKHIVFN
ncbi:uncharacterized protein LOC122841321 isoform X2 [Gambusia affinis]|uniref:uncharacterized protein LOC122841321 isoform X2 n=1 Tax=Gambusia affinis TaxID=33528 RepID=UPI001CDB7CB7|nr:uncharacterized protein LOC122841321 isoform X2 [Gambusia affinis]